MQSSGFDIRSLMTFEPPHYLCQKCCGLLLEMSFLWHPHTEEISCPVCHVVYGPTPEANPDTIANHLKARGLTIDYNDLIGHSRTLASVAHQAGQYLENPSSWQSRHHPYVPMRALFETLLHARYFVHFTTYGISHMLIGALKMAAQRVSVRGVVSNADASTKDEFTKYKNEAPKLDVRLFERSDNRVDWDTMPHQKLIVVDGLLAFKGSANLTVQGWRKAAQRLDVIEIVTNVNEVIDMHNKFFSPVWGKLSPYGNIIDTTPIEPIDSPF